MPCPHPKLTLNRSAVRFSGAALLVLTVGACHTWVPTQLGPSQQFLNGRTRVYDQDGHATIVMGPRVEGDSVIGRAEARRRESRSRARTSSASRFSVSIAGVPRSSVSDCWPSTTSPRSPSATHHS